MMGRGDNGDCTSALSSPTLPSSKKPPSRSAHDRWQRRAGKPLPGGQPRSRLEPKLLGAAQHLRNANCPAAKAMPDLLGIGADTVETQQHHAGRLLIKRL